MPFAWGAQANGRIDSSLMVDTGGGQLLRADAAAGLAQLKGAFRATFGKDLTTSECYRPYQRQVDLYNLYRLGQGNVAATPGGSIHGWGLAIDINSWCYGNRAGTPEHNWLIDAGRAYGWDWFGTGKPSGEAWHFDFSLTTTSATTATAASTAAPLVEDDMFTDADRAAIASLAVAVKNLEGFIFQGGTSVADPAYFGSVGSMYWRLRNLEGVLHEGGVSIAKGYTGAPGTVLNEVHKAADKLGA